MSDSMHFSATFRTRRGRDVDCDWCGMIITRGEKYATWGCAYDGTVATMRMHFDCRVNGFNKFGFDESWDGETFEPGEMKAGLPEYANE